MKCPNCGHEFEPDEDEDKPKINKKFEGLFYPGVQLKNLRDKNE